MSKVFKEGVRKGLVDTIAAGVKHWAVWLITGVVGAALVKACWRLIAANYVIAGWAMLIIAFVPALVVVGVGYLLRWRARKKMAAGPAPFEPHEKHLEIIKLLRWHDSNWLWDTHVAHALKIANSDAEHYLRQLERAGWAKSRADHSLGGPVPAIGFRLHGPGQQYAMDEGLPVRPKAVDPFV